MGWRRMSGGVTPEADMVSLPWTLAIHGHVRPPISQLIGLRNVLAEDSKHNPHRSRPGQPVLRFALTDYGLLDSALAAQNVRPFRLAAQAGHGLRFRVLATRGRAVSARPG